MKLDRNGGYAVLLHMAQGWRPRGDWGKEPRPIISDFFAQDIENAEMALV